MSLAFVPVLARPRSFFFASSSSSFVHSTLPLHIAPTQSIRRARFAKMTAGSPEDSTTVQTPSSPSVNSTIPSSISENAEYSIDTDMLKQRAMDVVGDVSERPLYYGQIVAYASAALIALTVLRAVVSAVDSIPLLPGLLELVGLSYTVWFFWRYVIFKESRQELLDEIEEFLGRARPQ
ncbi:Protein CURVATURE THYLAKOID 1A, chloroplastic [Gracilariopsis chorda]|uniref:Protein CURVATURE THYLAKOID 1A, chloroplastic n=1 Tax=Gracilariopsis chorda TaxID=448386 RepID=A0A2V3IV38_9FLOR|nr:Protein CURVATURE THYLAKOID 1A, chloroplastic [Gracilariopsis chorda]|eukprot:PXF46006.1 Protein CURVATURE THYLAKOID 1A, chloroplastic [Gracilariopsis chorda]